jgi:ribosomal protein S18 acetylase RimI-like enzyme
MDFKNKYLKYKKKYLELKNIIGGDICEGKKVVVAESPDFEVLLDNFYDNPLLVIGNEKSIVPHLFWKKIIKMIIDCSYESLIFQYKQAGALTDEKLESLNLLNDKDFLKKKIYKLKYSDNQEYNEIEIILKFLEDFLFVLTDDDEDRKMYILVEEPKVLNNGELNNYEPISMLTVWDHNPSDSTDDCDYYLGNFCTTPGKRGKGCGRILLENILQKLKGVISLEVDKEDPRHNIKSHDSLVKYYQKFGFEVSKNLEDTTLMKKFNN